MLNYTIKYEFPNPLPYLNAIWIIIKTIPPLFVHFLQKLVLFVHLIVRISKSTAYMLKVIPTPIIAILAIFVHVLLNFDCVLSVRIFRTIPVYQPYTFTTIPQTHIVYPNPYCIRVPNLVPPGLFVHFKSTSILQPRHTNSGSNTNF